MKSWVAIVTLTAALSACQKEDTINTIPSGYMRSSGDCIIDSIQDGKIYIFVETGDGFQHIAAEIYGYEEDFYGEVDDTVIDSLHAGQSILGAFYEDENFNPQKEKSGFIKITEAQPVIFF